jgi:hypothetical protein
MAGVPFGAFGSFFSAALVTTMETGYGAVTGASAVTRTGTFCACAVATKAIAVERLTTSFFMDAT